MFVCPLRKLLGVDPDTSRFGIVSARTPIVRKIIATFLRELGHDFAYFWGFRCGLFVAFGAFGCRAFREVCCAILVKFCGP